MPSWTGTAQNDVITPTQISGGVRGFGLPAGGADTLDGGLGNDTLDGGGGGDLVLGGAGDDLISVTLTAAPPPSAIDGAGGPADGGRDPIPPGPDSLSGGAGADLFRIATPVSGAESAIIDGGTGVDTVSLTGGGAAGGTFSLQATTGGHVALSLTQGASQVLLDTVNVESVRVAAASLASASLGGSAGADNVVVQQLGADLVVNGGSLPAVTLSGLAAAASLTIATGDGADTIDVSRLGAAGHAQVLDSGAGDDVLFVSNSVVQAGAGDDVINWLRGGADTIDGGAGFDTQTITTQGAADIVSLSFGANGHLQENLNGQAQDVVGVETINIATGDRADTVTVGDLSHTDVRTVNIDLSGATGGPDGAVDVVNLAAPSGGQQIAFVQGADGHSVRVTYAQGGFVQETVNIAGLDATDRVGVVGGAGDDAFTLSAASLTAHLAIDGGEGDNVATLRGTAFGDSITASGAGTQVTASLNGGPSIDMTLVQTLNLAPLDGPDAVRLGNFLGTSVREVNVDLAGANGQADGQLDTVDVQLDNLQGQLKFVGFIDADGAVNFTTQTFGDQVLETVRIQHLDASDHVNLDLTNGRDMVVESGEMSQGLVQINAGDGDDSLITWNLVANGEGGNDTIDIHGGLASGGDGADTVRGSFVSETLKGDAGDDSLIGNGGADFIDGGDGRDTIFDEGAVGATLAGGAGDDKITANESQVTMLGGDGNDQLIFDGAASSGYLSGGAGDDFIASTGSLQTIQGDDGADSIALWGHGCTVHGGAGDDIIGVDPFIAVQQNAANVVFGDAGDDVVSWHEIPGEPNALVFDGGTGNDVLDAFYGLDRGLTEVLSTDGGDAFIKSGFTAFNGPPATFRNVETVNLTLGSGADHLAIEDLTGSGIRFVNIDLSDVLHASGDRPDGMVDSLDLSAGAGAETIVGQELGGGQIGFDGMPASITISNMDAIQGGGRVQDTIWLNAGAGDDLIDLRRLPIYHGIYVEGGFGNDTISAGAGPATFNFDDGLRGFDVIDHYQVGLDRIDVKGLEERTLGDMIARGHLVQDGADVDIFDGRGALLKLTGIDVHSLTSADFLFHPPEAPPGF